MSSRSRYLTMGVCVPIALMIVTTIYVVETFSIKAQVLGDGIVGPRTVPLLAALGMYISLAFVLVSELRKARATEPTGEGLSFDLLRPALVIVATAVYIVIFRPFGYAIATTVYVAALFVIFGFQVGRPLWFVIYLAALVLGGYVLFAMVFGVRLPPLPWGN